MDNETAVERRNYYVGETYNQLRHGYGVYYYNNKYFRYEGDWINGKKHGHGKLIMGDGSYYEGEFKDGEIDGHGFRKWQHTGNCYSGEFLKGEMQGHGVMNYADGSQYQGEFFRNQRHGTGILKEPGNCIYEGSWYKNKKHGQGIQSFDNGDEYEGDWVDGTRQGHGELVCADRSTYTGQWRNNMFNGQGVYTHISGVVYEGLWINNFPDIQPAEIVVDLPAGQSHIEVIQGKLFSIRLHLVTSNKKPVSNESGRVFRVSAGYKFVQPLKTSQSQSFLELIEDLEAKPILTSFGYEVLPYPLVEYVKEHEELEEQFQKQKQPQSPITSRHVTSEVIHEINEAASDVQKMDESGNDNVDDLELSSSFSGSKLEASDLNIEDVTNEDDVSSALPARYPPPSLQRSNNEGMFEFQDLLLPCAPDNYRPFLLEDEVQSSQFSSPTGSTHSSRRGTGSTSMRLEKKRSRVSRTTSAASSSSTSLAEPKTTKGNKGKGADSDEKGSKAGDYVLIVEEVTSPPFMDELLPPVFILVKVIAPKITPKKGKRN